jgi:hypothetical protein
MSQALELHTAWPFPTEGQRTLQAPQWSASVVRSTQVPAQSTPSAQVMSSGLDEEPPSPEFPALPPLMPALPVSIEDASVAASASVPLSFSVCVPFVDEDFLMQT